MLNALVPFRRSLTLMPLAVALLIGPIALAQEASSPDQDTSLSPAERAHDLV